MISTRLLQRIETHWESIAAGVIEQCRTDPRTPHHKELEDEQLNARARDLVHSLGEWLTSQDEGALARRYEQLGRSRFAEGVSLAEVIYKMHLIELKTVEYIQHANIAQSAVEIFGELEMLRALHRFFAIVVDSVVSGYEQAASRAWTGKVYA